MCFKMISLIEKVELFWMYPFTKLNQSKAKTCILTLILENLSTEVKGANYHFDADLYKGKFEHHWFISISAR